MIELWASAIRQTASSIGGCILLVALPLGSFAQPSNDDCISATAVTVDGSAVSGTLDGATNSGVNLCGGSSDDDVWYAFVAPASGAVDLTLSNIANGSLDLYHTVLNGTCAGGFTSLTCSDPNSSSTTGLTPGQTYYVQVYSFLGTPQTTTFDLTLVSPPGPVNDGCTGATPVTVDGASVSGTLDGASDSSVDLCGGTSDDDVWYAFVAPASGAVDLTLSNIANGSLDLYHTVLTGTCAGGFTSLTCRDPNTSSTIGLIPGQTYYVQVYSFLGTPQTTTFDITLVSPPGPVNDGCTGAAPVTVDGATVSGTLDGASDSGVDLCGGTSDDDVWYSFVAPASGAVDITLSNIANGSLDLYHTVLNGTCAGGFTSLTCSDPNSSSTTGLTPGQTYYVQVYSFLGTPQTTSFDLSIEAGSPPLPVVLTSFSAEAEAVENRLAWTAASELDLARYVIERRTADASFRSVGEVLPAEGSVGLLEYTWRDATPAQHCYYRLRMEDIDGTVAYSSVVVVTREAVLNKASLLAWPNPATDGVVHLSLHERELPPSSAVLVLGAAGRRTRSVPLDRESGTLDVSMLSPGVYLLSIASSTGVLSTRLVVH